MLCGIFTHHTHSRLSSLLNTLNMMLFILKFSGHHNYQYVWFICLGEPFSFSVEFNTLELSDIHSLTHSVSLTHDKHLLVDREMWVTNVCTSVIKIDSLHTMSIHWHTVASIASSRHFLKFAIK